MRFAQTNLILKRWKWRTMSQIDPAKEFIIHETLECSLQITIRDLDMMERVEYSNMHAG